MNLILKKPGVRHATARLLAAAILAGAAIACAPGFAKAARPNIVVIQTDDQSASTVKAEFREKDGKYRKVMPHTVKGIFDKGTEFDNYYAVAPVCSPSRASLLTGDYPHNTGLETNDPPLGGWAGWQALPVYRQNVPVTLQRAGYRTAHFGKLINGYFDAANNRVETTIPPGWDSWFTTAFLPGTHYYGYQVNDNGRAVGPFGDPDYQSDGPGIDSKNCTAALLLTPNRQHGLKCNYLTDVMTRSVVREIRHNRSSSPFYLQVDYQGPHGDVVKPYGPQPATRHLHSADRTPLPRPKNFNEADISDKSPLIQGYIRHRMDRGTVRRLTDSYRRNIESLRAVDDGVGAIIKTLRQTGQLKNTYIFYISDHGIFLGEHRFNEAKFLPYDPASKVAMAVRGPGVPKRSSSREVTANIDIPATALKLAHANAQYSVDGRPLGRYWRHPGLKSRRPVEISLALSDPTSGKAGASAKAPALRYRGFRVGPYKYIDYAQGGIELYDLSRDPFELRNVADAPAYSAVAAYMKSHLAQVAGCQGRGCRLQLPRWPEPSF